MQTSTGNLATHADPMIGEILGGRYVVERLLDRGGMGLVYLATEIARERHVVIKMLAPHWTEDADAVARFDREGESLARLEHPNIVELFDVGRAGEQAYIAMEYIDGEPLRRYLKRKGHTTLREFGPIASQILSAVGYAHAHGIMLRDIKPSNIMLCERDGKAGFVKLLDFGLAKLVGGADIEITKAHVVGTAGYLSPEQIRGESIDARVDVYALGVLFFVMLTGTSPIAGDNDAAVLYNHVHGAPKRLADELPTGHEVPTGLIELVHQCLEKEADRRPDDAAAIAEALFDCLPPEAFVLPEATQETRDAVRTYREAKLGIVSNTGTAESGAEAESEADDDDASSAEWTRPVLRKPTPSGSVPAVKAGTWKTLTEAAQAATAAKRRAASKNGNATRVGLPAVGLVEPSDSARRPPPAKLDPRKRLRRTGPRKIVRTAEPEPPRSSTPVAAGVDATLPAGSGHVGSKARSLTRSDGSGIVRDEARPVVPPQDSEPAPPPTPVPVPALASPSAAPAVSRADPAPVIVPIEVFESTPIDVERPRSSMGILLVVGFVALAVAAASVYYVAFVRPTPASSERADHGNDPGGAEPEASASERVEPAEAVPEHSMAVLELTVPAGARVRIDGEARDSGRMELSVGRHRIEVVAPGHERWIRDVELLAGDNPPMTVELIPATAADVVGHEPRKTKKTSRATRDETPAPVAEPEPSNAPPPQPKKPPAQDEDVFMPGRSASDDGVFLPVGKKK